MALSKIRLANKKAKHEHRRKVNHQAYKTEKRLERIRRQRMRHMMFEGRKEHLAHQRRAKDYVKELEAEL